MRSLTAKQQKNQLKLFCPEAESMESTKLTGLYWYAIKNDVRLYFHNEELLAVCLGQERFVFSGALTSVKNAENLLKKVLPVYTKITLKEKKIELLENVKNLLKRDENE